MKTFSSSILFSLIISSFFLSCNLSVDGYSTRRRSSMIPYTSEGKHHGSFLKTPELLDAVHYYIDKNLVATLPYSTSQKNIMNNNGHIGRVVAISGDILEIKDGFAYRNGVQMDGDLNLIFFYEFTAPLTEQDFNYIRSLNDKNTLYNRDSTEITFAVLTEEQKNKLNPSARMKKRNQLHIDIFKQLSTQDRNNWDGINYGPITIPENHYFVLEDRRAVSFGDSRQYGSIPEEWIKASFTD